MKRILFMDLDGTFLRNADLDSYSKKDMDSLIEFQKQGNYLVVTTGRVYEEAKEVLDKIAYKDQAQFIATGNGSVIHKNGKQIHKSYLKSSEMTEIVEYIAPKYKNTGFKVPGAKMYYSNSKMYKNVVEWFTNLERRPVSEFKLNKKEYSKFGVLLLTRKSKNYKIWNDVKAKFPKLNFFLTGHDFYLEIVRKDVSKGEVVKKISKELGIKPKDCLAAGDSGNDHSMFREVGYPIMMKNTPTYIQKEIISSNPNAIVTDKVSSNGLSQALKKLKTL